MPSPANEWACGNVCTQGTCRSGKYHRRVAFDLVEKVEESPLACRASCGDFDRGIGRSKSFVEFEIEISWWICPKATVCFSAPVQLVGLWVGDSRRSVQES